MHKSIVLTASFLLAFVVSQAFAICCGRGSHYYCNDCSTVYAALSLYSPKCCYSGSHYNSCNIFCCNCKKCKKGHAHVTFVHGWFLHKKYQCKQVYGDVARQEMENKDQMEAKNAFDQLDKNFDERIDPDEFLHGLRAHMNMDNGDLVAADLMRTDDQTEAASLADAVNSQEMTEDDLDDFEKMAYEEFQKMDANNDGFIQAQEFDSGLA